VIVYSAELTELVDNPPFTATALSVVLAPTDTRDEYCAEEAVGMLPSVV
jgi:hypothetical protein